MVMVWVRVTVGARVMVGVGSARVGIALGPRVLLGLE